MSSPAGGKLFLLAGVVRARFVHSLATAYDERVERKHTPARQSRSVARLAAVQALYQMEVGGAGAKAVAREFVQHRFDADLEGEPLAAADQHFFAELIEGVVASQAAVDRAIVGRLASGWKLKRLDATARAILRAGAYELIATPKTPREIVIDEYVEIAKSFFAGVEVGFINATLDAIARDARGE